MTEVTNEPENWQLRAETAEAALARTQADADGRLIRAELKVEALRAGMIDLDGLKLLDIGDVQLTEHGEIADVATLLSKLKRAKPWLFGGATSSSAALNAPRPEAARTRHANELSHEEWIAARAALVKRR